MVKIYKWINQEKARYYTIAFRQAPNRKIVINYSWGGCHSNRGGKKNILLETEEEAQVLLVKMMKRRKRRGYELVAS